MSIVPILPTIPLGAIAREMAVNRVCNSESDGIAE